MPDITDYSTDPPEGAVEFIQCDDGCRIRTVWAGSGPTVVLVHGYLLDLTVFKPVFQDLVDRGHRVIAFDLRGHGGSTGGSKGFGSSAFASDYGAVLDHFAVSDGQLIAHSLGAFLGIVFCIRHRELAKKHLKRLIFLGGNAGAVAKGSLQNRLQIPLLKTGLMKPIWKFGPTGKAFVAQLFGPQADSRMVEALRTILLRQNVQRTLPVLKAMIYEDYYSDLGKIPFETEVLCGTHDRTCPKWHSERLGAELPNASNTWLQNVGHMLTYEAPTAVLSAVLPDP